MKTPLLQRAEHLAVESSGAMKEGRLRVSVEALGEANIAAGQREVAIGIGLGIVTGLVYKVAVANPRQAATEEYYAKLKASRKN